MIALLISEMLFPGKSRIKLKVIVSYGLGVTRMMFILGASGGYFFGGLCWVSWWGDCRFLGLVFRV